ncbi:MAG: non-homologous end-joining DNA ligase [Candidatus Dormibacteraeota bacterium]|nr:non-homologous end-joining DNA ligase [Candidatus Dormibacteraeota bacterium]
MAKLGAYQKKRDFERTSEPAGAPETAPEQPPAASVLPLFVVQEHHARRLHWDFRLERDGVLVSWAVPRGLPEDPKRNHLAVHVEDHPLDYGGFEGDIPKGNYGAGQVTIWDRGTYETHKWSVGGSGRQEVMVTLHGRRVQGRYVLFQTRDENWMIHRMDAPQDALREPLPDRAEPMLARLAADLPADDGSWAFEFKWDGIRALGFCESGRLRLVTRNQEDVTSRYPEIRAMAAALGSRAALFDGEVVALDEAGIPSFERLQQRMGLTAESAVRRRMADTPVVYLAFDLLHSGGRSLMDRPYLERRQALTDLALAGASWQVPAHQVGGGAEMQAASASLNLEGVMAKRLDSRYEPGRRSGAWLKLKNHMRQELVIAGWTDGEGRRSGHPGALLIGYWDGDDLVYAGKVGTGFNDQSLDQLAQKLEPLGRPESPFGRGRPPRAAHFVEPRLVAEFEFANWTQSGQLRAPVYKGLRADKEARDVVRESPAP